MLVSLLAFAAIQGPTITLQVRGTRLPILEPILAKEFKEPVFTPPYMKNTALTIKVKDVSAAELRDRIAKVLNASWIHDSSGWRLTQSGIQKRDEEQTSLRLRNELVSKNLAKAKKRADEMKPFTNNSARRLAAELEEIGAMTVVKENQTDGNLVRRLMNVDSHGPFARFAARLSARLSPELYLACSDENPRVVYSTNPTKMQYRMNVKIDDLLDSLIAEQGTWSAIANGRRFKGPSIAGGGEYIVGNVGSQTAPLDTYPATTLIVISDGGAKFLQATLKMFDKDGRSLVRQELGNVSLFDEEVDAKASIGKTVEDKPGSKFKLSPESEEVKRLLTERIRTKATTPALRDKLLNPDQFDPTSYGLTEQVWFSAKDRNVVAVLPTNLLTYFDPSFDNTFAKSIFTIDQDSDWLTMSYVDPFYMRKVDMDRKILKDLIGITLKSKFASVDTQAAVAYALPWKQSLQYEYTRWISLFKGDVESNFDFQALRIWASLPDGFKKATPTAKQSAQVIGRQQPRVPKNELGFGKLSEACQLEVRRAVFANPTDNSNLTLDFDALIGPNGRVPENFNDIQAQVYNGLLTELTQTFGSGIPSSNVFQLAISEVQSLSVGLEEGGARYYDPQQVGQNLFQRENLTRYPYANQGYYKVSYENIRLVNRRTIVMFLTVVKGVTKVWKLTDTSPVDSKTYTQDTLPDAVKAQIKRGYEQAKAIDRQSLNIPIRGKGGGGNIPPSR